VVAELLERWFPAAETMAPSAELSHLVVARCNERGVAGGSVYDALVALTAAEADALLVTRDARAARTYERLGVRCELVS
jgi:toxin FitB